MSAPRNELDRVQCRGSGRSQRVTIGRYDRSLVRDDSMSLMIPYDSQDFPSASGIGPGNLTTSWGDLLWAGLTVGRPALETVYEPGRNTALFDHLRYWAYPQSKGDDLDAWRARRIALQMNARFPDPLPEAEARKVSWSVASWTWSGGGPMDHSIPAQRRRGIKSGLVRRNATRNRDAAIVAAVLAAYTLRRPRARGCPTSPCGTSSPATRRYCGAGVRCEPIHLAAGLFVTVRRRATRQNQVCPSEPSETGMSAFWSAPG